MTESTTRNSTQAKIESQVMTNIFEIVNFLFIVVVQQLKICQIMNISLNDSQFSELPSATDVYSVVKKIYNFLLKNSNFKQNQNKLKDNSKGWALGYNPQQQRDIDTLGPTSDGDHYDQIQELLQKQQNKNRVLIKRQLEFKEYQNGILDELNEERLINEQISLDLKKTTHQLREKESLIMHLQCRIRALQRDSKTAMSNKSATLTATKSQVQINQQILPNPNISPGFGGLGTMAASRQLQSKTLKKNMKDEALYAMYASHKNKAQGHINNHVKTSAKKKNSDAKILQDYKLIRKNMLSGLGNYQSKKNDHGRNKSEELRKRVSSQRTSNKKKTQKQRSVSRVQEGRQEGATIYEFC